MEGLAGGPEGLHPTPFGPVVSGAVGVASGVGVVVTRDGGEIVASIKSSVVPECRDSVHDVFGVEWLELKARSDISASDGFQLPSPLPQYGIVTVEGDVSFSPGCPLRGTAALVVRGNVVLGGGSNIFFNGVLYVDENAVNVDGKVVIRAPARVRGTVVAPAAAQSLRGDALLGDDDDGGTVAD